MMKRVKLIYNPSSGEAEVAGTLDRIVGIYQDNGYSLVPYRLTFDGNPYDMIADLDDSYDHLIVAGGDGSVNYVVNLLKRHGIDIPLGLIPAGTANDFAALFGYKSSDILKTCQAIIKGKPMPVDLGKANGEYFVNVFSCGLFTDISQKTPTILKNTFGKLAYYAGGIGELTRFRKMYIKIESDGGNYEGESIIFFVFNGRTAGRFKIAYQSQVDDGKLDILIVKGDNPLETIRTILHYLTVPGSRKSYPHGIEHIRCTELTAECTDREPTDIDGQPGPDFPVNIRCEKAAIRIIRPGSYKS